MKVGQLIINIIIIKVETNNKDGILTDNSTFVLMINNLFLIIIFNFKGFHEMEAY